MARAQRIPLQHITGRAAFGPTDLRVGPGCSSRARRLRRSWNGCWPRIFRRVRSSSTCAPIGALAVALADALPGARVTAVDDDATALDYARRNATGTAVEVVAGDVTDPGLLPGLVGSRRPGGGQSAPGIPEGAGAGTRGRAA